VDVSIVSPEQEVWRGEADMVVARSPEGEFAILRGHIPFLAALVPGIVKVVSDGDSNVYFVPGGVLEASGLRDDYHVIVLADTARTLDEVDVDEAKRILEEQRGRMEDVDQRAEAEMRIALARVELARQESLG
jgi:F-type H+-transporting ATPase subunit epsilon